MAASQQIRALILNDNQATIMIIVDELRRAGFAPVEWKECCTEEKYLALLTEQWDVILATDVIPQWNGLKALNIKIAHALDIPFIFLTHSFAQETHQSYMDTGADSVLFLDRLIGLGPAIRIAIKRRKEHRDLLAAEDYMRRSKEEYQAFLNTLPGAVVVVDVSGIIIFASSAVHHIFGWEPDQLLRKPLTVLIPPELHVRHRTGFQSYIETGRRKLPSWEQVPLTAAHATGKKIAIEISFAEMRIAGERRFLGLIQDVTEREQIAETLQSYARAMLTDVRPTDAQREDLLRITQQLRALGRTIKTEIGQKPEAELKE